MRDPEGIARAIQQARTVCVCSHISPDGDTIGSALAMRLILERMGKRARVFCQDKVPDNLLFLSGAKEITGPEKNGDNYDLMLAVDVSDQERLGSCAQLIGCSAHTAQIDHHGTNPEYAEVNSIDGDASATCVMILEQMRFLGVKLDQEIAECLYVGLSTDTGNFSFDCTNPEAFRAAAELLEAGLPLADLSMRLFREKSKAQLKLLGRAIDRTRFEADGRIAVMTLTRKDFEDCGALSEHSDAVVNYGLETLGTEMALLGKESEDGRIKFSLRSRAPLTVDDVAAGLGGGGHAQAAGIAMDGDLESCTEKVLQAMILRLKAEK